jgi:hypothetical protein
MIQVIRNASAPICRMCKNLVLDSKYPNETNLARCKASGKRCLITGEITYDYADYSRRNFILCGEEGKFFEKKKLR